MELREKIAAAIMEADQGEAFSISEWAPDAADAILSLPEIKEALRCRNVMIAAQMPDLPPERMAAIFQDLNNRTAD